MERGEIYLVEIPFTDGAGSKERPAIVISADVMNLYSPTVIVVPVTSKNIQKVYPFEVLISARTSGLDKDSKVMVQKVASVEKNLFKRKLGKVSNSTLKNIIAILHVDLIPPL